MEEQVKQIEKNALEDLKNCAELKALEETRVKYLGKKGELTALLKQMGSLSKEERPVIGSLVNKVRDELEEIISSKEVELKKAEIAKKLESEKIDVTLPSTKARRGSKHPLNRVIEEVEDLFVSMGYDVISGPELETDEY